MNEFFIDLFKDEYNERKIKEVCNNIGRDLNTDLFPTKIIKNMVVKNCKLSEEFIDKYFAEDKLDRIILSSQKLSSKYILEKIEEGKVDDDTLSLVLSNQDIEEEYLVQLINYHKVPSLAWSIVSYMQKLSLDFIRNNIKYLSNHKCNLIYSQPEVDFNFLSEILDLNNIKSYSEEVVRYMTECINLPEYFIRENWDYLNTISSHNLLFYQPRVPKDLLLQLKDLLGDDLYNKRIFKDISSSGNYSLIYIVCDNNRLILHPMSFNDLEFSFEYESEGKKTTLYKAIVDIRKIPRLKFFYDSYCEKLIEVSRDNFINGLSLSKRFEIIPFEKP